MDTVEARNRILKIAAYESDVRDQEALVMAYEIMKKYEKIEKITFNEEEAE